MRNQTTPTNLCRCLLVSILSASSAARVVMAAPGDRSPAKPADEPLITDRPDFTESTESVTAGRLQIEVGYTFSYDRERKERLRDQTAPELLVRIGVVENFELRIGWDGYSWSDNQFEGQTRSGRSVTLDDHAQGAHDLSLGFKYKLREQEGPIPHLGVIGAITVPTGSAGITSGDVDPEIVLLWAYDVSDSVAIAGNVGLAMPTDDGDRFFQTSASFSVALSLTESIGAYVEYFGFYPNTERSNAAHSVNGGVTYLINDDFQIDWRIGAGLNEEADDFFMGVGFARRF